MSGARPAGTQVLPYAVGQFVLRSVVVLGVLILAVMLLGHRLAADIALRDADERARRLSQTVGRLVTEEVRTREPGAALPLTRVLQSRFDEGYLLRARVLAADGTVLWSNDPTMVGQRVELGPQEAALLKTSGVDARFSDSEPPASGSEGSGGRMLEVSAGSTAVDGAPILFETAVSTDQVRRTERAIVGIFLPVGVGGLLLLAAAVLPLAVTLCRRVQRSETERTRSARHALAASELERQRIAQELHDGVVQDLAGVGFTLASLRRTLLDSSSDPQVLRNVAQAEAVVHRDVSALRSMMIEVYPPDLGKGALMSAIEDAASAGRARGLTVDLRRHGALSLSTDASRLVYRVAREGLHNVAKHARATAAVVEVVDEGDAVVVRVLDDGRGVQGHGGPHPESLGLRLLHEAVGEVGGTLSLRNRACPGEAGGAVLEAVIPLAGLSSPATEGDHTAERRWWRW